MEQKSQQDTEGKVWVNQKRNLKLEVMKSTEIDKGRYYHTSGFYKGKVFHFGGYGHRAKTG